MTITIRRAQISDAEQIARLSKDFSIALKTMGDTTEFRFDAQKYIEDGFGESPAFQGLVAEIKGIVVGYLLYHFGYDVDRAMRQVHIVDFYIHPDHRNVGIGTLLMKAVAQKGLNQGANELFFAVFKPNTQALGFYKKLGARCVDDLNYLTLDSELIV